MWQSRVYLRLAIHSQAADAPSERAGRDAPSNISQIISLGISVHIVAARAASILCAPFQHASLSTCLHIR